MHPGHVYDALPAGGGRGVGGDGCGGEQGVFPLICIGGVFYADGRGAAVRYLAGEVLDDSAVFGGLYAGVCGPGGGPDAGGAGGGADPGCHRVGGHQAVRVGECGGSVRQVEPAPAGENL